MGFVNSKGIKEVFMKKNHKIFESFVLITQIGITMIVPVLLCTALGVYVAEKTNIKFLAVILIFIGIAAGFQNVYKLTKHIWKSEERDVKKDQ